MPGMNSSKGSMINTSNTARVLVGPKADVWGPTVVEQKSEFVVQGAGDLRFKAAQKGPGSVGAKVELVVINGVYDFWQNCIGSTTVPLLYQELTNHLFKQFTNIASIGRRQKKPINTNYAALPTAANVAGYLSNYCAARHVARLLQAFVVVPENLSTTLSYIRQAASAQISNIEGLLADVSSVAIPPWLGEWVDEYMAGIYMVDTDSIIYFYDPENNQRDWTITGIGATITAMIAFARANLAAINPTTIVNSYINDVFTSMYNLENMGPVGVRQDAMCWNRIRTSAVLVNTVVQAPFAGGKQTAPSAMVPPNSVGNVVIAVDKETWRNGTRSSQVYLSVFREPPITWDPVIAGVFTPGNNNPGAFILWAIATFTSEEGQRFDTAGTNVETPPGTSYFDGVGNATSGLVVNGALWRTGDINIWIDAAADQLFGLNYNAYIGGFSEYSLIEMDNVALATMTQTLINECFYYKLLS